MSRARVLLIIAAVLFLAWLGWMAVAVYEARWATSHTPVVSRGQLTAASHLFIVEVSFAEDGMPLNVAKVIEVIRGQGVNVGDSVTVRNLHNARPPGAKEFTPGPYLLAVVGEGSNYSIVGLPRSPGYEAALPERPAIYPWNEEMRAQLRGLGIMAK